MTAAGMTTWPQDRTWQWAESFVRTVREQVGREVPRYGSAEWLEEPEAALRLAGAVVAAEADRRGQLDVPRRLRAEAEAQVRAEHLELVDLVQQVVTMPTYVELVERRAVVTRPGTAVA